MLSEKVRCEKEVLFSAPPQIDIERVKFLLDVYRETEGQPSVIRRAKLFQKLCNEKTIFIDDNPIVGSLTRYKFGGYPVPEFGAAWMKRVDRYALSRGEVSATKEQKEWIDRAVDYWKGKNTYDRTKNIILESCAVDIGFLQKCGLGTELTPSRPMYTLPDYSMVLNSGLQGIIDEIQEKKEVLNTGDFEDLNKWYFYDASLLCLRGMIELADRYASLAKEMASEENNPERKRELERISIICERVPANPARNFNEAIQSVWFVMLGIWLETQGGLSAPPSRFSQYMIPFFNKDKEQGVLADEDTIELLHFFFLKMNSLTHVQSSHAAAYNQSRLGFHLSIGGLTPDGEDATNELDYLVLEAQRRICLPEPLIALLYHNKVSDGFLLKCVDLIRTGIGQPAFHDVDKAVARHLYHDSLPLEEARNICIVGCVQSAIPGYSAFPWEGFLNVAKMVELALNDGKDPLTGKNIGPKTGDAEAFQSYEDFYGAFLRQTRHFIPLVRQISRTAWNIGRDFPVPFQSAITNDCIEMGKDITGGGARYDIGNGSSFAGVIDSANSLAAVKRLVFEEKKLSMKELRDATAADFEGYEDIYHMCLGAPKYGNDDNEVDSIAKELYEICWNEHQKFHDFLGRHSKAEAFSAAAHFGVGRFTGALPSGRKARLTLADASVSASPGTDKNGPTALIKSAAKIIDTVKYGSNHLNMKFHPTALEGLENARKFLSMTKTYFDLGGYHVQFNCVSSDTLRDAQLHPENYKALVIRVAGFSAFFATLDRGVQDEIIKRTELAF